MADADGDGIESRMHTNSSKCVWLKMLLFVVDIIRNSKRKENVRSQHTSASTSEYELHIRLSEQPNTM